MAHQIELPGVPCSINQRCCFLLHFVSIWQIRIEDSASHAYHHMRNSVYSTISVPKPPPGKAFCKKTRQSFQFLTRFKFSVFSDFCSYFLLYSFFHIRVYRFSTYLFILLHFLVFIFHFLCIFFLNFLQKTLVKTRSMPYNISCR